MSLPSLRHLEVDDLVAQAGSDPWAVDDSLQVGSPTQINFLAQAFHSAADSATSAEQTFGAAQQHFEQYNRENGEQPINNGTEVQCVKAGLQATNQQLRQITSDLNAIAAALAGARTTSQENITALNANLQGYDSLIFYYASLKHQGYDVDAQIDQCHADAVTDTETVLHNVTLVRNNYSKALRQALKNLQVIDGTQTLGVGLQRPIPLSPPGPSPVPLNPYVTVPANPYPPGDPKHLEVAELNTQLATYGADLANYSNKPAPLTQPEYLERYAEYVQLQGDLAGIVAGYRKYNIPISLLPPAPPPNQPTSVPHR